MRFELMTSSLPRRRSTPELRGRRVGPVGNFANRPAQKPQTSAQLVLHEIGAGDEIRTRDPQLGRLMLYQLSYTRSSAPWCRGQDSNLRRALARRVYSPVPLTTRPPLQYLSSACWSRRRDLNPRPSDYKSDALPTELRRPATERDSAFRQNSDTNNTLPKTQVAQPIDYAVACTRSGLKPQKRFQVTRQSEASR